MKCRSCGQTNQVENKFCGFCGRLCRRNAARLTAGSSPGSRNNAADAVRRMPPATSFAECAERRCRPIGGGRSVGRDSRKRVQARRRLLSTVHRRPLRRPVR